MCDILWAVGIAAVAIVFLSLGTFGLLAWVAVHADKPRSTLGRSEV